MNKSTLIIATVTFLLLLTVGAGATYILFFAQEEKVSVSPDPFSNPFPFSEQKKNTSDPALDTKNQGAVDTPTGTISIRGLDGFLNVRDFTKDADVGITVDGADYYVAFPKEFEFSDTGLQYEISYIPEEQRIYLSIFTEPIGDIRRMASNDLMQRLNLSSKELCVLDVLVVAPRWVNQYYADTNLGFPGCPGSVKFQGDPQL